MKTVIFDFDGTLTKQDSNIWKQIWNDLGCKTDSNSYYVQLYNKYVNKEITYQQWNDLACEVFIQNNLHVSLLDNLINEINLIDGVKETFEQLTKNNIEIIILSGNIDYIIKNSLKDNCKYVKQIVANNFVFNEKGNVIKVIGNDNDFEGKYNFVKNYIKNNNLNCKDVVFVGNGPNDEFVHLAGCKTICINPNKTNSNDKTKWNVSFVKIDNLTQILPEILK